MSLSLRRRPVLNDAGVAREAGDSLQHDVPPIASGRSQSSAHLAAKAATGGLWVCLLLGPLGAAAGGLALLQASQPAPVQQAAVVDASNERAAAGEFAQRVVLTWLTTTREQPEALTALLPGTPIVTLPHEAFKLAEATVARIAQYDGTWSVTVAATVTDARGQRARRFYQVPVQVTGDGAEAAVTALTLPAPVSPPVVGSPPRSEYVTQLDPNGAVGTTVTQFLAAYVAGTGDVSRYLTPGAALTPLTPPPYTEVRLEELRTDAGVDGAAVPPTGQQVRVLATAVGTVTDRQASTVTYALSLTARAGRWEITAIDPTPTPALRDADAARALDETPSSSGSSAPTSPTRSTPADPTP